MGARLTEQAKGRMWYQATRTGNSYKQIAKDLKLEGIHTSDKTIRRLFPPSARPLYHEPVIECQQEKSAEEENVLYPNKLPDGF
jgi:hypothetical protein